MKLRILSVQDFGSGIMFIGFGAIAAAAAPRYGMGSELHMGPGYFPFVLGALLMVIGAALIARSFKITEPPPTLPKLRPFIAVIGASAIFAAIFDSAGIVTTTIATLAFTYWGMPSGNFRQLLLLCVFTAAAVCVTFVYILNMPLPIWPHPWN